MAKTKLMDEFVRFVDRGDIEGIKRTLSEGVDVNCKSGYAINFAAITGNLSLVKFLLKTAPTLTQQIACLPFMRPVMGTYRY